VFTIGDFEKEQQRLSKIWEDEDADPFADCGSSDEYVPSDGESEISDEGLSDHEPDKKKDKNDIYKHQNITEKEMSLVLVSY
jgi:hypothetical protein